MSTVDPTDLFLVSRGGVNYTVAAADFSKIQDTDILLVSRGGITYQTTGAQFKGAGLLDTDLLLVARASTNYSVSFAGVKSWFTTAPGEEGEEEVFTTPGTFNWEVPSGVTSICLVAIGGGAGGGTSTSSTFPGDGGAGGGLVWANDLPVTPGQSLQVIVGGESTGGSTGALRQGKPSSVERTGTGAWLIRAYGGNTSDQGATSSYGNGGYGIVSGIGGNYAIHRGGPGYGGSLSSPYSSGSGGGAAGYTAGGAQGNSTGVTDGGQGGELGTELTKALSGAGGGVGLYGTTGNTPRVYSQGGSGGANGLPAANPTGTPLVRTGGAYGGGGGGEWGSTVGPGRGAQGAVRILWGANRSFPSAADAALDLNTLLLADVAGGNRFTSVAFPITVGASGGGTTLALKAWVTVQDMRGAQTDTIATINNRAVTYSNVGFSGPWSKDSGNTVAGTAKAPAAMFDVGITDFVSPDSTSASAFWDPTSFGLYGRVSMVISMSNTTGTYTIKLNGKSLTLTAATTNQVVGNAVDEPFTSLEVSRGATGGNLRIHSISVVTAGKYSKDLYNGDIYSDMTFASAKELEGFSAGDHWTATGGATGLVTAVNKTTSSMTVRMFQGTLAAGEVLTNSKLTVPLSGAVDHYLTFTSAGVVSTAAPSATDTGYQAWSPTLQSKNNWKGNLTFPATLGGTAPDALFPAGKSRLTVQARLTDGTGKTVEATSNSVLPA